MMRVWVYRQPLGHTNKGLQLTAPPSVAFVNVRQQMVALLLLFDEPKGTHPIILGAEEERGRQALRCSLAC